MPRLPKLVVNVCRQVNQPALLWQVPMFPPLQTKADMTEAACLHVIRAALGPAAAGIPLHICTIRTWTMSGVVASKFQVRPFQEKLVPDAWWRWGALSSLSPWPGCRLGDAEC